MSTVTVSLPKYLLAGARLVLACLVLALCLPAAGASATPAATMPDASPSTPAGGLTDRAALEAFLDGIMSAQMAAHHVPGAAVAVVQDGRRLLAKGYGLADRERDVPVVADQTLFRVGSVGKTVTWTAVMQLVEAGKLDLHADVNTYLTAFKVPATYPQPITLAHLLTHTAGFDDKAGILARSPTDLRPLGAFLAASLPARVRPPGQLAAYSNHGTALAGYIVEQVSGMPYDQYVEQRIFAPLEMRRSTTRVPVPADLAADLAAGYTYEGGAYQLGAPEYLQVGPAGAMSATATDMARFMLAHLQAGRYGETRILQPATAAEMQRRQFGHDPRVSGLTYGFMEMTRNGQRLVWHAGDTELFHNLLVLLPEHGTGVFMTYNGVGGGLARMDLLTAFLDRYFPAPAADPVPATTPARPIDQFAGSYWPTRSHDTTWTKLRTLLRLVNVSATDDGSLTISGQVGLDPAVAKARWVEVEPLVFRQVNGEERLVFTTDAQGRVTHLFIGNFPIMAFTRLAWYETLPVHLGLLAGSLLLFLSALIVWPLGRLIARWRQRRQGVGGRRGWRPAVWLLLALSGLNVVFALGFAYEFLEYVARPYAASATVLTLLVLPLVTTALTLGMVAAAVQAWRQRHWHLAARLHYSLVTVTALAFVWWLNYWNLLGFRL